MPHVTVPWPDTGLDRVPEWEVQVDGLACPVQRTPVTLLTGAQTTGAVEVAVRCPGGAATALVRPLRHGITVHAADGWLRFLAPPAAQLEIEIPGQPMLTLFLDPPPTDLPDRSDPQVRWYGSGVHEVGPLRLESGQTLYLESGCVLRGSLRAVDATGVRVCGRGIIDGRHLPYQSTRLMVFEHCRDLRIEGVIALGTPSWTLVLGACDRVLVDRFRCIGWVVCSDGIDVVGCRQVRIRNCYLRCNDDCIAIKSVNYPGDQRDWRRDVEDVVVESCILHNDHAGNAMEIGFETRCARISDIAFRDIDVVAAHGEGGVFTIHAGDRALIENVRYEDIRVEHYYDKFVDFRIMHSRYSQDVERGRIRNVALVRVRAIADAYNCVSLCGGFDAQHDIQGVRFEDVRLGDVRMRDAESLNLFVRHAGGIVFA